MRVRRARRGMAIVSVVAIVGAAFLIRRRANDAAPPTNATPAPAVASLKVSISYDEARPILDTHRASLPAELNAKTPIELESFWPAWVSRHNTEIRSRLERGDEDSIVNLWLYGTTFTTLPRATDRDLAMLRDRARSEDLLLRRLDDLVAGLAAPGGNERLRFARQVVERHGIDPTTPAGGNQARAYLVEARERTIAENQGYRRTALSASQLPDQRATRAAFATLFRDRGLSSDTSISADFALDQALGALTSQGKLGAGSVRRVAIVQPRARLHGQGRRLRLLSPTDDPAVRRHRFPDSAQPVEAGRAANDDVRSQPESQPAPGGRASTRPRRRPVRAAAAAEQRRPVTSVESGFVGTGGDGATVLETRCRPSRLRRAPRCRFERCVTLPRS